METSGSPKVPGDPLCARAVLLDPGRTSACPGSRRASVLPYALPRASAPTLNNYFGADSHGPFARCLRLVVRVTPNCTQDSLPARLPWRLPAGVDYPTGSNMGFQLIASSSSSLLAQRQT